MPKPENPTASKTDSNGALLHEFNDTKGGSLITSKVIILIAIFAVLGIGTGYMLSRNSSALPSVISQNDEKGTAEKGKIIGSDDLETYKDEAEGKLKKGGIDGEGQYHLERPGGESQNVYLTSSTVDLSEFLGNKIKVWGQTQTAQKAGWLMDVGRVEVLE